MALPVLPYRQPRILSACARLGERIREEKARSVPVVTDKGILRNGLAMPVEAALRESGMGAYHSKAGFDAFSHFKSIVEKKTWLDLPMRYQPYSSPLYEKLLHFFLKQSKKPSASFRERGRGFLGQARKHTPLDNDFRAGYNAF